MIFDYIVLDKEGKFSLCTQLYQGIQQAIEQENLKVGERLPSIRVAAKELSVSRTTVETAYIRLCNAGYVQSRPQSGYVVESGYRIPPLFGAIEENRAYTYDFSSRQMDKRAADTARWQTYVRQALRETDTLLSYGAPQGETALREAIAQYSYRTRGVTAQPEQILIGAGMQSLLMLFCSLYPKRAVVALDAPILKQAERIFSDFGFRTVAVSGYKKQPISEQLMQNNADLYFYTPSVYRKKTLNTHRVFLEDVCAWANAKPTRFILEDDYNGELRYTARPTPAIQAQSPQHVVYLGSFSKLLLPSVRIAYAVLPHTLLEAYQPRAALYNPTASKLEQLALAAYIRDGALEKHLRRLRKLYAEKSKTLARDLEETFGTKLEHLSILETSLSVVVHLKTTLSDENIKARAERAGIRLQKIEKQHLWLSFSGMPTEEIPSAVKALHEALKE